MFFQFLRATGCFVTEEVDPKIFEDGCTTKGMSQKSFDTIEWIPASPRSRLVFLGDLLDGKRLSTIRRGSEELIIKTLVRLQKTQEKGGHQIIWVLGNHDVQNTMNGKGFCERYANGHYCDDEGRFTPKRTQWVRKAIADLGAKAIVKLDDGILACHGGICSDFLDQYDRALRPEELLDSINADYLTSIQGGTMVPRVAPDFRYITPTWCRRGCEGSACDTTADGSTYYSVDKDAMNRLGVTSVFVAHTVQDSGHIGISRPGSFQSLEPGKRHDRPRDHTMYFTDLGMSRAFRENCQRPNTYQFVDIDHSRNTVGVTTVK